MIIWISKLYWRWGFDRRPTYCLRQKAEDTSFLTTPPHPSFPEEAREDPSFYAVYTDQTIPCLGSHLSW